MENASQEVSLEGLSLQVADVERSVDFYRRFPGAELVVHRPGQFALLRIGAGRLNLLQMAGPVKFHMEVEARDLSAVYERLRVAGIEPNGPPQEQPWGETDFRVTDPDGNVVEFAQARSWPAG